MNAPKAVSIVDLGGSLKMEFSSGSYITVNKNDIIDIYKKSDDRAFISTSASNGNSIGFNQVEISVTTLYEGSIVGSLDDLITALSE